MINKNSYFCTQLRKSTFLDLQQFSCCVLCNFWTFLYLEAFLSLYNAWLPSAAGQDVSWLAGVGIQHFRDSKYSIENLLSSSTHQHPKLSLFYLNIYHQKISNKFIYFRYKFSEALNDDAQGFWIWKPCLDFSTSILLESLSQNHQLTEFDSENTMKSQRQNLGKIIKHNFSVKCSS